MIRSFAIPGSRILDVCAVDATYGHVLILQSDGEMCGVNLDSGEIKSLCSVTLPALPECDDNAPFDPPGYRLHANARGTICAIVVDQGRSGGVVDTSSGNATMSLDGGDYFDHTVPFSVCFLPVDDTEFIVHRSAWNRLDASDPVTGSTYTTRNFDSVGAEGQRPLHYLDYFHGRLLPSPDGRLIFDDGWVWHPVSVPRIWSAPIWLQTNPWESEDGSSLVELTMRDDWNSPACWVSDRHIAIWGVVDWDEEEFECKGILPGVQISDTTSKDRSSDSHWLMDIPEVPVRDLFSDGEHLIVAVERVTSIWNIASRSKLLTIPDFLPRFYDCKRRSLVAARETTLLIFGI
ncbi:hypothetical protein ABT364_22605 [Massilia sp. SR12]